MTTSDSLRELADRFSAGWHDGIKIDASDVMLLTDSAAEIERLRDALTFYAEGSHFSFDRDAWDTVSDEPQNFWCDEAGTATVEDGTIAKLVLAAATKETP